MTAQPREYLVSLALVTALLFPSVVGAQAGPSSAPKQVCPARIDRVVRAEGWLLAGLELRAPRIEGPAGGHGIRERISLPPLHLRPACRIDLYTLDEECQLHVSSSVGVIREAFGHWSKGRLHTYEVLFQPAEPGTPEQDIVTGLVGGLQTFFFIDDECTGTYRYRYELAGGADPTPPSCATASAAPLDPQIGRINAPSDENDVTGAQTITPPPK